MKAQESRELRLMRIAQEVGSQKIARNAMGILRIEFDKTYGWCEDCDGLVIKESDCCLNKNIDMSTEIEPPF
ncbi:MAG: hypothetical protein ACI9M3_000819 [Bacteroidia bacterium]|jgi:hypothetical protein